MNLNNNELENALKQEQCSDELVKWVAKEGTMAQQAVFLFASNRSSEVVQQFRQSNHPKLIAQLLIQDEDSYLAWAMDLGFEKPNFSDMEPDEAALGMRWQIDNWVDNTAEGIQTLYDNLVPREGSAETLQGELVRAVSRIQNEHSRNAMTNWGDGYYEQLAELIHTTLTESDVFTDWVKRVVGSDIDQVNESGLTGQAIARGERPHSAAFHPNFLVASDVERAHQRLNAVIAIWCERKSAAIPFVGVGSTIVDSKTDSF